ncbi:hypothetical protein J6590_078622 [Homalodisca vitripennis]|nr:hypothetical protein J6590_078622 [Homalodisca vitripennis]
MSNKLIQHMNRTFTIDRQALHRQCHSMWNGSTLSPQFTRRLLRPYHACTAKWCSYITLIECKELHYRGEWSTGYTPPPHVTPAPLSIHVCQESRQTRLDHVTSTLAAKLINRYSFLPG